MRFFRKKLLLQSDDFAENLQLAKNLSFKSGQVEHFFARKMLDLKAKKINNKNLETSDLFFFVFFYYFFYFFLILYYYIIIYIIILLFV